MIIIQWRQYEVFDKIVLSITFLGNYDKITMSIFDDLWN